MGDVSVVADLYRQHGAFVHTISHELVGAAADRLTQQVFTEAWSDRSSFNPSLGTVRNWLVRRARARVSKISPEAELAVDRLVVADSLHWMDDLRRQVVVAGIDATNADALARRLDQPVATIRANLRRGTDQLMSDLAESRTDGDEVGLMEIMSDGPPDLELVTPPEVVWQAIAAELDLDTAAVTTDDLHRDGSSDSADESHNEPPSDDETTVAPAVSDNGVDSFAEAHPELTTDADGDNGRTVDTVDDQRSDDAVSEAGGPQADDVPSIEELQAMADAAELDRPSWIVPAIVVVALVVLIVVMLTSL